MKGELIVGIAFIIIGLIIKILNHNKKTVNTAEKRFSMLSKIILCDVFLIIGFLSISQYFLDINNDEIHWKNGIFLFFVILSLTASTDKIIDWILQKMENKKKNEQ